MAAIVIVISGDGFTIEECHRNQLALYKLLLHFNNHLKQLYISNKMEHFIYKDGCGAHGHTCIEAFKRRAGLAYT